MTPLRLTGLAASAALAVVGLAALPFQGALGQGPNAGDQSAQQAAPSQAAGTVPDGSGDPAAASGDDGKWFDKNGTPTYKIAQDGTVDYYTFAGYIRYSANCLQCHGPDALGSTYAPSLVDSLQHLAYGDVLQTVAGGKKDLAGGQELVMPALGDNKNVMCYIDAIYIYLRARSDGALPRGRPAKHAPKPETFTTAENQCMG